MRIQPSAAILREIFERGDSTLISESQSAVAAGGASAVSAGVSPPAGKRWLVMHAGIRITVDVAQAGAVRASGYAGVNRGIDTLTLVGHEMYEPVDVDVVGKGVAAFFVLDENDTFVAVAHAEATASQVTCNAQIIGFEYEPL